MVDVLLIEPDRVLAKTYTKQLVFAGFRVTHADDGHDAIAFIDEQKPAIIVLEPQLAGNSGIDFLHELRSYSEWLTLPVIINSSVPEQAFGVDRQTWQRLGVVRYFYKPKTSAKQLIGELKTITEASA